MRSSRVYCDKPLQVDKTLSLGADASHYLSNVLRLRAGDELTLFNGRDGEFDAEVLSSKKNELVIRLVQQSKLQQPAPLSIHLGLGLSRGDRMDYAIQKSVELGVSQLTPLTTLRGEVKLKADRVEKKLQHWRKIAISACEQSGRMDIPIILPPCGVHEWQQNLGQGLRLILDPSATQNFGVLISRYRSNTSSSGGLVSINLMIGPEGGFDQQELDWAVQQGFELAGLGPRILRTETAPVVALAILQHVFGEL